MGGQRSFVVEAVRPAVRDLQEIVGDRPQDAFAGARQLLGQSAGAFMRFVHDHAPIDDEEDAARGGDDLPPVQPGRLRRQREHRDVHAGGLAGGGGQGDGFGPRGLRFRFVRRRTGRGCFLRGSLGTFQDSLRERRLPSEGGLVP